MTKEDEAESSYAWGLASKFATVILPKTEKSSKTFKDRSSPESGYDGASKETVRCVGEPGQFPSDVSGCSCGFTPDDARRDGGKIAADPFERTAFSLVQKHIEHFERAYPTDARAISGSQQRRGEDSPVVGTLVERFDIEPFSDFSAK